MKRKQKLKIAVFSSGFGSNLEALLGAEKRGVLHAEIALVVCDRPESFTMIRANRHKKPVFLNEPRYFKDKRSYEESLVRILEARGIGLIVLAGFMRILTPYFTKRYTGRILNIHPSLLPAFKGAHAIRDAFEYGAKVTGVTVHFVTEDLDAGPVVAQAVVPVRPTDTFADVKRRIHRAEHKLYPSCVRLYSQGRLKLKGRRVITNSR